MGSHTPSAKHPQHGHVLHKDGVGAGFVEPAEQEAGGFKLAVIYYCVHRDIHARAEPVGVAAQFGYVVDRVTSCGACAEALGPDVYGVCPMVYGGAPAVKIAGGCEQFELCHYSIRFMS